MYLFMKYQRAFTLIELLVVISIIALLSSIVLSSLNSARSKARDARRLVDLQQVHNALAIYALDNGGSYPSTGSMHNVYIDPGCTQSVSSPDLKTSLWVPGLSPSYISSLPVDPKPFSGGCYMYSGDGSHYLLSAYGTVEASSNGGKMNSDFGYREAFWMTAPSCYYSTSYPSIDAVHRKSFTLTNLTTSDFSICPKIGP
jgi:prepilin-type N-terminal cleavage/methylation domain-containing protein